VVLVGGPQAEAALGAFSAVGLEVRAVTGGADELRAVDRLGVRYTLVHVGPDDGEPMGTYERAHHRVALADVRSLAGRLRPRERPLVRCLAFGYQHGLPEDATWLVDVRFLDNPYWVEGLRPLDGRHPAVAAYVMGQPAAARLADGLESTLRWAIPLYRRDLVTVAFGCTGGRHRSVVMAIEMARRLRALEGFAVELVARDLGAVRWDPA
jgi:hypothetical protein